ncbi:hypothetical protein FHW12_003962 [Dokdonella fugitiva]|uniref:Uncharacterized protein n=1 Tax=Dokdonella fugitiva TaxID=328517 RepID=A0A839F0X4_9GAMM|nr:hypothetical protein [Dokdonella fugitiva]MBA8889715.1 hypothetical protein [Dokdonella fugitiva]
MRKPIYGLVVALLSGVGIGSAGTFLLTSSKVEDLVASSYVRSASDARSFAQVLDDIESHREAQAIVRLEGYLGIALASLGDYETVFPEPRREPVGLCFSSGGGQVGLVSTWSYDPSQDASRGVLLQWTRMLR